MTRPDHASDYPTTNAPPEADHHPLTGKIIPPRSPVNVPNRPAPVAKNNQRPVDSTVVSTDTRVAPRKPEDAGGYSHADARQTIDPTQSSWADSTQPAPNKKNARSSLL